MRHLLLFFALGGLLFGAKQLFGRALVAARPPVLKVHVSERASADELERAIDEAVLVEQAIAVGGALIDPVVREQLLVGMRRDGSGEGAARSEQESDPALLQRALALGLHRADPVVRQRLAFQAEQLLLAEAARLVPSDDELARYLADHVERYTTPARSSFRQLFLSRDRRGARLGQEADALLQRLRALPTPARELGDPTLLPRVFKRASARAIEAQFGPAFAAALAEAPIGVWSGPLTSSYGLHLVHVDERLAPERPPFDALRARLRTDYQHDQRRVLVRERIRSLRARYRIDVQRLRS